MLYSIQACRAVAALLVVFFHAAGNLAKDKYFGVAAEPIEKFFQFGGDAGVAFFFVLSGFIIHHVHSRDFDRPEKLLPYLWKRIKRIYPTYWIVFLTVLFLASSIPSMRDTVPSDTTILVKSLLLIPQDSSIVGGTGAPVLVVAWSLQYEIFFYAAFSLALINRWIFYSAAILLTLNVVLEPILGPFSFPRSFLSSHLLLLFGMGIFASVAARKNLSKVAGRRIAILSSMAFIGVAIATSTAGLAHTKTFVSLAYGMASAALIAGLAHWEKLPFKGRFAGVLQGLGDSSYALYLIHFPLIAVLSKIAIILFPRNSLGVLMAFTLLIIGSVAVALAFNILIERPISRRLSPTNV